jgi:hypothetical protein
MAEVFQAAYGIGLVIGAEDAIRRRRFDQTRLAGTANFSL